MTKATPTAAAVLVGLRLTHALRAALWWCGLPQVPAHLLTAKSESVLTPEERSRGLAVHPFVPSAEPTTAAAFLPGTPQDLMARGDVAKVPYIAGINSLEAGFMLSE